MRTIAIINEKGGTGKTTTAVNLSAALGEMNRRVLLVDLDGQAASSRWLGVEEDTRFADALYRGEGLATVEEVIPGVSLVPGSGKLDSVAHDLRPTQGGQLRKLLAGVEGFDFAVIDCPPSLGNRLIGNALLAATWALVPVETSILALDGLKILLTTLDDVRDGFGHDIELAGVLACRYDPRTRLSSLILAELKRALPGKVFRTVIRENVRVRECPGTGQSILTYAPNSHAAEDYRAAARELLERAGVLEGGEAAGAEGGAAAAPAESAEQPWAASAGADSMPAAEMTHVPPAEEESPPPAVEEPGPAAAPEPGVASEPAAAGCAEAPEETAVAPEGPGPDEPPPELPTECGPAVTTVWNEADSPGGPEPQPETPSEEGFGSDGPWAPRPVAGAPQPFAPAEPDEEAAVQPSAPEAGDVAASAPDTPAGECPAEVETAIETAAEAPSAEPEWVEISEDGPPPEMTPAPPSEAAPLDLSPAPPPASAARPDGAAAEPPMEPEPAGAGLESTRGPVEAAPAAPAVAPPTDAERAPSTVEKSLADAARGGISAEPPPSPPAPAAGHDREHDYPALRAMLEQMERGEGPAGADDADGGGEPTWRRILEKAAGAR